MRRSRPMRDFFSFRRLVAARCSRCEIRARSRALIFCCCAGSVMLKASIQAFGSMVKGSASEDS